MRVKKLNKKLNLSKITIANLENGEMDAIKGGLTGATLCRWTVCEYTVCNQTICVCTNSPD